MTVKALQPLLAGYLYSFPGSPRSHIQLNLRNGRPQTVVALLACDWPGDLPVSEEYMASAV